MEVLAIVAKSEAEPWLAQFGKPREGSSPSEVKDDLSRYLRQEEHGPVVITRHGKPAAVLIGFEPEDDWFEFKLGNDPRSWHGSRRPGRA